LATSLFSFFSFFFILFPLSRRQSFNQNQTLWNPGPLAYGKPPYTKPKDNIFSNSWLQSCLRETAKDTGVHHTPCLTPPHIPPPQENNPMQPLSELTLPSPAKLKAINSELYCNTDIRSGAGMLNQPWRMAEGQRAKLSLLNCQG
jgi:hypothetical protein